jgi:hypothetical protein
MQSYRTTSQLMLTRDPHIKAQHFQDCARESLRRTECAKTSADRRHHLTLARHYLLMGQAELEEASKLLAILPLRWDSKELDSFRGGGALVAATDDVALGSQRSYVVYSERDKRHESLS